ncbi:MAG TPA: Na+/H+ antiporter NhaA [Anaerolineae bacterium]
MRVKERASRPLEAIREFLRLESASGLILIGMAILAMLLVNSAPAYLYDALLETPFEVRLGSLEVAKPLLLWINDGLMAIFFLLIGLEVKREILDGQLSSPSQVALPGIGAVGGIVVPVLIYVWLNRADPVALNGWAIPAATDIAFALGILSLFGERVPVSLKVFLLTLAILDDLSAIVIIAIFFTSDLSMLALVLAGLMLIVLFVLNRLGVTRIAAYALVGVALWVLVLKSGVHATLAGVALAFAIPLRARDAEGHSPLRHLEHTLHPWVAFGIMPIFAFANAGVPLAGVSLSTLVQPVPLGIAAGLFVGKQVGVFGFSWLAVKLGLARLPNEVSWSGLYGTAILCGIGFTMSLFIGSLAFEHGGPDYGTPVRLGILTGTLLSAVLGYVVLRYALPERAFSLQKDV